MKKIVFIILGIISLYGCNSENAWDCFQSTGTIVQQEYNLDKFKKIIVWNRVKLYVRYGEEQQVVIQSGENLMSDIHVRVEDSILKVSDRNTCNYIRDYGVTKVFVTTGVDSLLIRNSSGLAVEGVGPIKFVKLDLVSDDRDQQDEFHIDGDFIFDDLQVGQLTINANGTSRFYLKGYSSSFFAGLQDGDVRVDAGELNVNSVYFFHRSTNDLIVNPSHRLHGTITSLGDVISKNHPEDVNVEQLYTGQLIFE